MNRCIYILVFVATGFAIYPWQGWAASITQTKAVIGDGSATGDYSISMGKDTSASGSYSTAMGQDTAACGTASTAMNYATRAMGSYSTAMGWLTEAGYFCSTVIGSGYDHMTRLINNTERSFMVGYMADKSDTIPEFFVKEGAVGINTTTPLTSFHVKASVGSTSEDPELEQHVAGIQNTYTGTMDSLNVLMLKVANGAPGSTSNFISFADKFGNIGAIEGNGSGGIQLNTGGGDFAEYLPKAEPNEVINPGDIVGLFPEGISRQTRGAQRVMVVTTAPALIGNRPQKVDESRYVKVAFLGQVPVRIEGTIHSGDYIVPSGRQDGVGMAVSLEEMNPKHYASIVGRVLESNLEGEEAIKTVTVLVGLPHNELLNALIKEKEARIARLEDRLAAMESEMDNPITVGLLPGAGILMGSLGFIWMDKRRRRS